MKCVVCNNEFKGRSDAKFCSSKCRLKRFRDFRETDKSNETDNVPDNGAFDRGYCKCGKNAYFGDVCTKHYAEIISGYSTSTTE